MGANIRFQKRHARFKTSKNAGVFGGPLQALVDSVSARSKKGRVENIPLNICIQCKAGTVCVGVHSKDASVPGFACRPFYQELKIQPEEQVLGRISLQTSGQKLRSGPPNPGKKQAFWHRHPARTSTKKLRSEKLRADFSFPILKSKVQIGKLKNGEDVTQVA